MPATAYYYALLVAVLGLLAWRTWKGQAETARLKAMTNTKARQSWFIKGTAARFVTFGLGSVAILALIGKIDAIWRFPTEFAAYGLASQGHAPEPLGLATIGGMIAAMTFGALLIYFVWRFVFRRKSQPIIGDVDHLFPRNYAEAGALIPLAINAGVSEELFFRLALPLLSAQATGSAHAGFIIAAITFGLMHWYQGWKGVILTGLISFVFITLYLQTGSLLVPIIVHAMVDLLGIVIRPAIGLWLDRLSGGQATA